jgi:archaellum component FlaC
MNSIRKGKLMSSHEADRLNLHQTLRGLMPEDVADILMAHLPPVGWSNVATKDDINLLRAEMNQRFGFVDEKFKQIDSRLDQMDARFDQIDSRLDQMDARFDQIDSRLDQIDARLDRVDSRLDQIDARLDRVDSRLDQIDARLDRVDARFDRLETKIDQLASMKRYVITTGISLAALILGMGVPMLVAVT